MGTLLYIILLALSGLVIGALARLLLPGRGPMTILQTMLVGVAGSLIAGVLAYYAFDEPDVPGFLLALACTIVLVFIIRKQREHEAGPPADVAAPTRRRL